MNNDKTTGQTFRGIVVSDHVSEDAWEALACGELDTTARAQALDHITACGECDRIYRVLSELHAGALEFDPKAPAIGPTGVAAANDESRRPGEIRSIESSPAAPRPAFAGRRFAWIGLAAAAALVVAIVLPRPELATTTGESTATSSSRLNVRSGGHTAATHDEPIALSPVGKIGSPAPMIRWTPVDDVESYTVEILDESGVLLWVSEPTLETETPWPTLDESPARFSWRVRARMMGGLREELSEPAFVETTAGLEPAGS